MKYKTNCNDIFKDFLSSVDLLGSTKLGSGIGPFFLKLRPGQNPIKNYDQGGTGSKFIFQSRIRPELV